MSFRIDSHADLDREMTQLVRREIRVAIQAAGATRSPISERIHHARAACKKLRAALRLIRLKHPRQYARENAWFRESGRRLARFRDVDVMLKSLQDFLPPPSSSGGPPFLVAARRQLLAQQRKERAGQAGVNHELARFVHRLRVAERRWQKQRVRGMDGDALAEGFAATYRRARRAMPRGANAGAQQFHAWRKATKACGYQCRLLRDAWPAVMKALWREFSALGDTLGDEHDLSLLRNFLKRSPDATADPESVRAGLRRVEKQRRKLRREALAIGRRLFADKPRDLRQRMRQWWEESVTCDV